MPDDQSTAGPDDAAAKAAREALRARVVLAIADYMQSGEDPRRLKPSIVAAFPEVPTTTIYRWISAAMKSGAPGKAIQDAQHAQQVVRAHGVAGAAEILPRGTITSLPLTTYLRRSIDALAGVLSYAQGPDPEKPRNPKLTMAAAANLIRAQETALQVHEALNQARRLDDFHDAIIAAISEESPEVAARITAKLMALTGQLGAA